MFHFGTIRSEVFDRRTVRFARNATPVPVFAIYVYINIYVLFVCLFFYYCVLLQIFIKSTAGMRLLPEETQEAIYNEIYDVLGEAELKVRWEKVTTSPLSTEF